MTFSPFDHPFLGGFLGDEEIDGYFSADADIRAMLRFEGALAKATANAGLIPADAADRIDAATLAPGLKWTARIVAPLAGIAVSGGFFGLAFAPGFRWLVYLGGAFIVLAVLLTGLGLLRRPR